jgi:hypothetical protein
MVAMEVMGLSLQVITLAYVLLFGVEGQHVTLPPTFWIGSGVVLALGATGTLILAFLLPAKKSQ